MKEKNRIAKKICLIAVAIILTLCVGIVAYAYFSTRAYVISSDGSKKYARLGMELNLFFDKLTVASNTDLKILNRTTADEDDTYKFDSTATWGTAENPYIISELRHLRNLSVLQNIGYFDIGTDGDYEDRMPYFLVCKPDGTPVVINGSDMAEAYEPIGNDDNPFIGYVGGAFVDGTATQNSGEAISGLKDSDQSVIYNVVIQPKEDFVDVGLFGVIGYIGDESSGEESFAGATSVVTDLLLYDVQIKVYDGDKEDGWWERIADHLFNHSASQVSPIEDHHIGILAGHVEYATVNYISVYYSSDAIPALDISHVKKTSDDESANYFSASGIIGYIYQMNSTSEENVVYKDGTTNADVIISNGGVGSGGGLLSGEGRGYVTAKEVYEMYDDSGNVAYYQVNGIDCYSLLVICDGTYGASGNTYHLQDGTTVTMSTSGGDNIARIPTTYQRYMLNTTQYNDWTDFVVRYGTAGNYTYYHRNRTVPDAGTMNEKSGIYLRFAAQYTNNEFKKLCTQYVRDHLFDTQIIPNETVTSRYYFYDGVFTFALSSSDDKIEDTWTDANNPDTLTLGQNTNSDWKANIAEGNHSIAAYVKQVTSTSQLQTAADNNQPLFIMYREGNSNYIVTLAENSSYNQGDGEDALFTSWTKLDWMDSESKESLRTAFSNNAIQTSQIQGNLGSVSNQTLVNNWSNYNILNIGTATDSLSLSDLRTRYSVDVTFTPNTASTTYYKDDGTSPLESNMTVPASGPIIETKTETYSGFIYWVYYGNVLASGYRNNRFTYYYMNSSGSKSEIKSRSDTAPATFLGTPASYSENGTPIYSVTISGTTYRGPCVLYRDSKYYASWTYNNDVTNRIGLYTGECNGSDQKTVSGGNITYSYNYNRNYFLTTVTDTGTTYKYNNETLVSEPTILYDGNGNQQTIQINGNTYNLYQSGSYTGIKVITYNVSGYYTFGNNKNGGQYYLRILHRRYSAFSDRYSIMCSTNSYANTGSNFRAIITPTVSNSTLGSVSFAGDGSCTIAYTLDGNTRYLAFDDEYFHGVNSTSASTKLYIYTVEGTQDVSYGRITFDPIDQTTKKALSAGSYVLWPDTMNSASTSYTVKQIEQGGVAKTVTDNDYLTKSNGWKTNDGNYLSPSYLSKQFSIDSGISSVTIVAAGSGDVSFNNENYVRAPIGSTGEESYIPIGCVAFRVNKEGTQKIRVIVAVPQTDYYYNESNTSNVLYTPENSNQLDYSNNYFFGLWSITQAGSSFTTTISANNPTTRFYLPRSAKYAPGSSVTSANPSAITVNYNSSTYRSYLNGEKILVAYEFTVSDIGIYLLGSNLACDIVYFSADATASGGQDGQSSYKMGTIDYVYTNTAGSKVLTVKDTAPSSVTTRDYGNYYYQSYALMYTLNDAQPETGDTDKHTREITEGSNVTTIEYPNVNNVIVYIKRDIINSKPTVTWNALDGTVNNGGIDGKYVKTIGYNLDADTIVNSGGGE